MIQGSPGAVVATSVCRTFATRNTLVEALGPLDLTVGAGEFVSIVGPSGCGKSTLLKIIAGLVNPTSGTIDLTATDPDRRLCAMVFQEYGIYPWMTVAANVRFGLTLEGARRAEAEARAKVWIDRFGLEAFADSYPTSLSGGMRQRVAIARALTASPDIVLMDEPFAALDAQLRRVLQDELLAVWESDRRTVVLVTHSLEEAILLSDRVVLMSARPGRVMADHVIPFERPRRSELRSDPAFQKLESSLWEALRAEVDRTLPAGVGR